MAQRLWRRAPDPGVVDDASNPPDRSGQPKTPKATVLCVTDVPLELRACPGCRDLGCFTLRPGVRIPGQEARFDGWLPRLDGGGQAVRLGRVSRGGALIETIQPLP